MAKIGPAAAPVPRNTLLSFEASAPGLLHLTGGVRPRCVVGNTPTPPYAAPLQKI